MNTAKARRYWHLIYDLYGCPSPLLDSPAAGLEVVRDVCKSGGLTIVGQFRKRYSFGGYSCGLFLSESHITLHTWPECSYCAVDMFLCAGNWDAAERTLLREMRPERHRKRVLVRGPRAAKQAERWIHSNATEDYYEAFRAERVLLKRTTPYQSLQVIENPTLGKVLLLDDDIQLATRDERIYHEFLVHPAMLAHPCPKSVLILGGGDGGALREVAKYPQIDRIVVVDIDKDVVQCAAKVLQEVNNNSFSDPRVALLYMDAGKYLGKESFDVIIIDLTAPDGVSIRAYDKMVQKLPSAMNDGAYTAMHSGWWACEALSGYPDAVLHKLNHVLVQNMWIPSFACFWSFVLGWRHGQSTHQVLSRISSGRVPGRGTTHFDPTDYASRAFVRASDVQTENPP
jgi:spermidine synthase